MKLLKYQRCVSLEDTWRLDYIAEKEDIIQDDYLLILDSSTEGLNPLLMFNRGDVLRPIP